MEEQELFATMLKQFPELFIGKSGHHPDHKFHLELVQNAKPKHFKPYSIPQIHYHALKTEMQHACDIGVSEPFGESKWASPCFVIPKKMDEQD